MGNVRVRVFARMCVCVCMCNIPSMSHRRQNAHRNSITF